MEYKGSLDTFPEREQGFSMLLQNVWYHLESVSITKLRSQSITNKLNEAI